MKRVGFTNVKETLSMSSHICIIAINDSKQLKAAVAGMSKTCLKFSCITGSAGGR